MPRFGSALHPKLPQDETSHTGSTGDPQHNREPHRHKWYPHNQRHRPRVIGAESNTNPDDGTSRTDPANTSRRAIHQTPADDGLLMLVARLKKIHVA